MMTEVNIHYLGQVVGLLVEAEAVGEKALTLDANDPSTMKTAYSAHIVPWIEKYCSCSRDVLRLTLAYFLKKPQGDFADTILATEPDLPLNNPRNPRLLFVWLWEVLFPDEKFEEVDIRNVVENNDIMKLNEFPFHCAANQES